MSNMKIRHDHSEEAKFAELVNIAKARNLHHIFVAPKSNRENIEVRRKGVVFYVEGQEALQKTAEELKRYLKRHDIFSIEVHVGFYREYSVKAYRRNGISGGIEATNKSRNGVSTKYNKGGDGTNHPSEDGGSKNGGSEW